MSLKHQIACSDSSHQSSTRMETRSRQRFKVIKSSQWMPDEVNLLIQLYRIYGPKIDKIKEYFADSDKSYNDIKVKLNKIIPRLPLLDENDPIQCIESDEREITELEQSIPQRQEPQAETLNLSESSTIDSNYYPHQQRNDANLYNHCTFLHLEDFCNGDNTLPSYYKSYNTHMNHEIKVPNMINQYTIPEENDYINYGSYCVVVRLLERKTNNQFAGKVISKQLLQEHNAAHLIQNELILAKLNNPNIIRLYDIINLNDTYIFVIEYCEKGDLYTYVESQEFDETKIPQFIEQMVEALFYLHSNQIPHNDVKLENFLLDSQYNLKLADFGFAGNQSDGKIYYSEGYEAPEIQLGKKRINRFKADIYSLGVTIKRLIDNTSMENNNILLSLIDFCCTENPRLRPTIFQVKNHPFFTQKFD
ncbi:Serine/threonine-protein kinase sik2 [Tritrichomonas musculus]|uniref:Serine/threonine-protein kinase sik2 n=1 Tax=Tritrichomonas musculus TaxID=1915356 RepID=A0ABR2IFB0_9EUKA